MEGLLAYDFMQRAFAAGIMAGLLCSFVSLFVVMQRLAFAGAGISHSALGGVAVGVLAGVNPVLSAGLFCTFVAWLIGFISRKGNHHEDTVIGVLFSTSMALGIALVSLHRGYYPELMSLLFGNILAVTGTDLWILGTVGAVISLFLIFFFKELLFLCFDQEAATAAGIPTTFLYYALLTVIALTIVVSVKILGIVLASALLVIPAITGYELARNYRGVLAVSLLAGVTATVGGLVLSYGLDLPSGATIVLCSAFLFFTAMLVSPRRRWRQKPGKTEKASSSQCR